MSLKQELQLWASALRAYEVQDFDESLDIFRRIAPSSKICFNIGIILATLGEHEEAVDVFAKAVDLDKYMAVSHFQRGVSNFLLERFADACDDFENSLTAMRSATEINYTQLGLDHTLHLCEILFNRGLSLINMGNTDDGVQDLGFASREKRNAKHLVIDEALASKGAGFTMFSVAVGVLFRPSASKLSNLAPKDYLGASQLIVATRAGDNFTSFAGPNRLLPNRAPPVRPSDPEGPSGALAYASRSFDAPKTQPSPIPQGIVRSNTFDTMRSFNGGSPSPNLGYMRRESESAVSPAPGYGGSYDYRRPSDGSKASSPNLQQSLRPSVSSASTASPQSANPYMDTGAGRLSESSVTSLGPRPSLGGRLKIRLWNRDEVRNLTLDASADFRTLMATVRQKMDMRSIPRIQYKDPDGVLISLVDDSDWQCALEEMQSTPGFRLELVVP